MKINLNHQKMSGEWHKHCRKRLGFRKIANRARRAFLKKFVEERLKD